MSVSREAIEEMLELCWTAEEDGLDPLDRHALPAELKCFLPSPIDEPPEEQQAVIDVMIRDGLLLADGARIRLSPSGMQRARELVRRHRLTEVLLHHVLEVSEEAMESTACRVEHILSAEVTEAVCTFLGHPPSCPHGRAIPAGACCAEWSGAVAPLIVPLVRLGIGEDATVAFVHTRKHSYLQRLGALGIVPGTALRVRQTHPAIVIQLGETELALDREAGEELYVRRHPTRRERNDSSRGWRRRRWRVGPNGRRSSH
ncbi:MAG TPA: metal-dependent transcriptional regulator [bacterium]